MKVYDFRFNEDVVKSFIGKTLTMYKHAEFIFTNSVTGIVGFSVGDDVYGITDWYEAMDFFGLDGESTVLKLEKSDWDKIDPSINNDISENMINDIISKVVIVNDHTTLKSNGIIEYDMWDTKAIIFYLANREICFAKQDCWFSQEIEIFKGYDLVGKVGDGQGILEDFEDSDNKQITVERTNVTIE